MEWNWQGYILAAFCILGFIEFVKKGMEYVTGTEEITKKKSIGLWVLNLVLSVVFGIALLHIATEKYRVFIDAAAILAFSQLGYDTLFQWGKAVTEKFIGNKGAS